MWMAEIHLDHPGEITWCGEHAPSPILGPCPHVCDHNDQRVIAWGPDLEHYELAQCDVLGGCNGQCRAWTDGGPEMTTAWLQVEIGNT